MGSLALHSCEIHRARAILNRLHILFHLTTVLALIYYRISNLFDREKPLLPWLLVTIAELIFSFLWFLTQGFRWRPVTRTVHPENIPRDVQFPAIDVLICTADPKKEPVMEVMNTLLSAMALDYPPEKLAVYLSDDGGSPATLFAVEEACSFAASWIPFCRKYGVKTRCPEAYFSALDGDEVESLGSGDEFKADEERVKSLYKLFAKNVENTVNYGGLKDSVVHDRPPRIKAIHDSTKDTANGTDKTMMPLLVYVSREKRPGHPHRFKAGALNALVRVSGIISNAPYLLVLDCDMYCNDPTSARQAMCFHLDPHLSPSLAFVQYPQIFYNVRKNDIYDGQGRSSFKTKWQGMDGLRGPLFNGTGYYLKRKALFGSPQHEDEVLRQPEKRLGASDKFIASLKDTLYEQRTTNEKRTISDEILKEATHLATCTFERGTDWGEEIGYSYHCLLESSATGYLMQCRGWRSVYLYPKRPCFLGSAPVGMKDASIQLMKFAAGWFTLGLSRLCALTYGMSRMSILQSMCYGYLMFTHLHSVAFLLYGTVPQLCLFNGIPLYPKVSSPWFAVFPILFLSSLGQHIHEVLFTGGSLTTCWNEYRSWIMRTLTGCLFGCLDVFMEKLGLKKVDFWLTNKAITHDKLEKYEKGKFDFQGAEIFMVPLKILTVLNAVCFVGGAMRMITGGISLWEEMFGQLFVSSIGLVASFPILEELFPNKNK